MQRSPMNAPKNTSENIIETLVTNISKNLPELPDLVKTSLAKTFKIFLNQLVNLDEEQGEAFEALDQKVIQITLKELSQTFFVTYHSHESKGNFSIQAHLTGASDCHIKTTIKDLIQQSDSSELTGDTDVGKTFIFGLQQLEIDWEEQLSHLTGDLIAFKVGHAVRETCKANQATQQKIGETLKEYLQFEVNLLPTKHQVNHFNQQVEQTEQAIDAIDARINQLMTKEFKKAKKTKKVKKLKNAKKALKGTSKGSKKL